MTIANAAKELQVSKQTIGRWLKNTTPEVIPRRRFRMADPGGKYRNTQVVEYNALHDYSLTL